MYGKKQRVNPKLVSLTAATLLLVFTFALIGFVVLSVVLGSNFGNRAALQNQAPQAAAPEDVSVGTPAPLGMSNYRDTALGFEFQYPKAWKKNEHGLYVIVSPSGNGLDPENLQDAAIWFGIPADNTTDAGALLSQLQGGLSPNYQTLSRQTMTIGGQPWQAAHIQFDYEPFNGPATATLATTSRDNVGYYFVAMAPTHQWSSVNTQIKTMLNSFNFTSEAVLRPTDATPPPTPTPTPTPVVYIVQSGDTLGKIAIQFDVDIETLAARNGIDDPRYLRTGAKLVIPRKRR